MDKFIKDNGEYVKKIESKLSRIKGAKCFVINLLKRADSPVKINVGDTVIQIPYLIDGDTGEMNFEAIEYISGLFWRKYLDCNVAESKILYSNLK